MVTIKDVAKESGVAISTVSNVLNNVDVVSDETKKKVLDAVKRLNYIPNINARLLKSNQKNTIGLFVQDLQGSFYNLLIQETYRECKRHGYLLNIYVCDAADNREAFSIVSSSGVAAAILINILYDQQYIDRLLERNMPLVFLDRDVAGINVSSRLIANYEGAAEGVEYLIQRGNRKIGYIHGTDNFDNTQRYQAYLDVMKKRRLKPYKAFIVRGEFEQERAYEEIRRLLSKRTRLPDAIFCANDSMGFGCIRALRENGIHVPKDISILGFDDIEMSEYYIPPLTTVHSPIKELGAESAREAIRLAKGERLEGNRMLLPTRLIERESVQ